jgi:hypothetical protein
MWFLLDYTSLGKVEPASNHTHRLSCIQHVDTVPTCHVCTAPPCSQCCSACRSKDMSVQAVLLTLHGEMEEPLTQVNK